jgi:5'-3' exonuclease
MTNYVLIDGNSVGYYCNASKKLSLGGMPVQALYNFLRIIRKIHAAYAARYTIVVLWDGRSWRHKVLPDYKENRTRDETPSEKKALESRAEYKRQLPIIRKALRLLGVAQVFSSNMEADDLAAILADRYSAKGRVVLWTRDEDWIQLVGPAVVWKEFHKNLTITVANFKENTGVDTVEQFTEMKALAGDAGDHISGVGGIGKKGAQEFLSKYGSFANFMEQVCIQKTIKIETLPKKFRDLIQNEEKAVTFQTNMGLVDLRTSTRPKPEGLQVDRGEPNANLFGVLCDRFVFSSITQELQDWLSVFPGVGK